MSSGQKLQCEDSKQKSAKTKGRSILKNVVSLRVSDQEKVVLDRITQASSKNVSDIIREAIALWFSKHQDFAGRDKGQSFRMT